MNRCFRLKHLSFFYPKLAAGDIVYWFAYMIDRQNIMSETKTKPPAVLFLCTENYYESRLAEILFETEAQKMEVYWTSSSRALSLEPGINVPVVTGVSATEALQTLPIDKSDRLSQLPEPVQMVDFQNSDLVILLKMAGTSDFIFVPEKFSSWQGEIEIWDIPSGSSALSTIKQHVTSLLVRLILKGGKRPTISKQHDVIDTRSPQSATTSGKKSTIRVSLDSKGRRGKKVTMISDLPFDEIALQELATTLKQICGGGGTVKDNRIEIQGDHRDKILLELQRRGLKAKK
jgi:translation initiation factor 1